jgi:hypothetical protein
MKLIDAADSGGHVASADPDHARVRSMKEQQQTSHCL